MFYSFFLTDISDSDFLDFVNEFSIKNFDLVKKTFIICDQDKFIEFIDPKNLSKIGLKLKEIEKTELFIFNHEHKELNYEFKTINSKKNIID